MWLRVVSYDVGELSEKMVALFKDYPYLQPQLFHMLKFQLLSSQENDTITGYQNHHSINPTRLEVEQSEGMRFLLSLFKTLCNLFFSHKNTEF